MKLKPFILAIMAVSLLFGGTLYAGDGIPLDGTGSLPTEKGVAPSGKLTTAITITNVGVNPDPGPAPNPEAIQERVADRVYNKADWTKAQKKAIALQTAKLKKEYLILEDLKKGEEPPADPTSMAIDRKFNAFLAALEAHNKATNERINDLVKATANIGDAVTGAGDGISGAVTDAGGQVSGAVLTSGKVVARSVDGVTAEIKRQYEADGWFPVVPEGGDFSTSSGKGNTQQMGIVRRALMVSMGPPDELESAENLVLGVTKDGVMSSQTLTAIGQIWAEKRGKEFVVYLDKLRVEGPSGEQYHIDDMDGKLTVRDNTRSIHVPVVFPSGETRLGYIDLADDYVAACNYPGVAIEFVTPVGVEHNLMRTVQAPVERNLDRWKGADRIPMYKAEGNPSRFNDYGKNTARKKKAVRSGSKKRNAYESL